MDLRWPGRVALPWAGRPDSQGLMSVLVAPADVRAGAARLVSAPVAPADVRAGRPG